jgi:hypothetical protein
MSYSLLSPNQDPGFNSGVVKPFECLSGGWRLVKDQYFLFVGLCLIVVILVTCIPFAGIIYGAWVAGIYYVLLVSMRGEPVSFNMITKGFEFFSPAFLVALLSGLPFGLIGIGVKLMELRFDQIEKAYPSGTTVPDEILTEQLTYFIVLILAFAFLHLITGLIFPFAYQLIVERKMSGWQAIKLSARASRANFGGVLGLVVLEIILGGLGVLLCCVGLFFVMPVMKGAWAVAYRQVFAAPPAEQPGPPPFPIPPPPPPPPAWQ